METLPNDMLQEICSKLEFKDIIALSCTCKSLRNLSIKEDHTKSKTLYEFEKLYDGSNDERYTKAIQWVERFRTQRFDHNGGFTNEQLEILNCDDDVIYVQAFAGSGKTTTLTEYAKKRNKSKILYLTYNKELERSAKTRDDLSHVDIYTFHSFALQRMLKMNNYKNMYIGKEKMSELAKRYNISVKYMNSIKYCIHQWCASDSSELYADDQNFISREQEETFQNNVKRVLNDMRKGKIPIWHDVYLKLFQITKEQLDYDIIMVDEVQDCNMCQIDIIMNQKCRKVLVGDIHQQIYKFRNVANIFESADTVRYLSKSFRFGFEIADVSNFILSKCKSETRKIYTPMSMHTKIQPRYYKCDKLVIICRKNETMRYEALKFKGKIYMKKFNTEKEIEVMRDIQNVLLGNIDSSKLKHRKMKDFAKTYTGDNDRFLDDFVKTYSHNALWTIRINFVKNNSQNCKGLLNEIANKLVETPDLADAIITNVHQSKGLEFDNVKLSDDFNYISRYHHNKYILNSNVNQEECNLLYVAITRARENLIMNEQLEMVLKCMNSWNGKRIIRTTKKRCIKCNEMAEYRCQETIDGTLGLRQPNITIGYSVCKECY